MFYALFLSRQTPMIIKKIFSGFLPAGHKKIRSIRAIRVQAEMNYSETQITRITRIYVGWTLMIIRFHLFLSRQAPMIIKKIFSGFLPVGHKKDSFHSSYSCSGLNELFRNTNHSNDTNICRMNLNDNSFLSYISEPSDSNDYQQDFQWISARRA